MARTNRFGPLPKKKKKSQKPCTSFSFIPGDPVVPKPQLLGSVVFDLVLDGGCAHAIPPRDVGFRVLLDEVASPDSVVAVAAPDMDGSDADVAHLAAQLLHVRVQVLRVVAEGDVLLFLPLLPGVLLFPPLLLPPNGGGGFLVVVQVVLNVTRDGGVVGGTVGGLLLVVVSFGIPGLVGRPVPLGGASQQPLRGQWVQRHLWSLLFLSLLLVDLEINGLVFLPLLLFSFLLLRSAVPFLPLLPIVPLPVLVLLRVAVVLVVLFVAVLRLLPRRFPGLPLGRVEHGHLGRYHSAVAAVVQPLGVLQAFPVLRASLACGRLAQSLLVLLQFFPELSLFRVVVVVVIVVVVDGYLGFLLLILVLIFNFPIVLNLFRHRLLLTFREILLLVLPHPPLLLLHFPSLLFAHLPAASATGGSRRLLVIRVGGGGRRRRPGVLPLLRRGPLRLLLHQRQAEVQEGLEDLGRVVALLAHHGGH